MPCWVGFSSPLEQIKAILRYWLYSNKQTEDIEWLCNKYKNLVLKYLSAKLTFKKFKISSRNFFKQL